MGLCAQGEGVSGESGASPLQGLLGLQREKHRCGALCSRGCVCAVLLSGQQRSPQRYACICNVLGSSYSLGHMARSRAKRGDRMHTYH